jgi:hypothetical protein
MVQSREHADSLLSTFVRKHYLPAINSEEKMFQLIFVQKSSTYKTESTIMSTPFRSETFIAVFISHPSSGII